MFAGLVGAGILSVSTAAAESPRVRRTPQALTKDHRVVKGRLHPRDNRDQEDCSFLNAVGAVWSADIDASAAGYRASTGFLIDVRVSTAGALVESTLQAARGSSGSPLYGDFEGRRHLVIGMHQGIRGNGIDVSEDSPNVQLLFTPAGLALIRAAEARTPCT